MKHPALLPTPTHNSTALLPLLLAAPDWGALEGEALLPQRRPALQLNLHAPRPGGAAAGGLLVSFDDDQQQRQHLQQQQAQQWQAVQNMWQAGGQQRQQQSAVQQQGQAQTTLSDVWESADGGVDPWMDVEDNDHLRWQQQGQQLQPGQQVPPGALRVPAFAPRPGRQQLALSHSQPQQQQAAFADEGMDDEEWDEGMLEQVCMCLFSGEGSLGHCKDGRRCLGQRSQLGLARNWPGVATT